MAIALENGNKVWQKVKNALSSANSSPASQRAWLDGMKPWLAQQKRNPDLQFLAVDGVYSSSDGGNNANQVLLDSTGVGLTLYGIWLQKLGTVETIFKLSNNATTAATDGTEDIAIAATTGADSFGNGDDVNLLYPAGRVLSTGITVTENTTRTGSTLTLKANRMSGFIVIGA